MPLMPLEPIPGHGEGYGRKMPGETVKRGRKDGEPLALSVRFALTTGRGGEGFRANGHKKKEPKGCCPGTPD